MSYTPLIILHISGATIGLFSGFLAMVFRKGSGLHGAAGTVFYASMIAMTTSGAYIAAFLRPNGSNLVVALLTLYLVVTAQRAAKRRDGKPAAFDVAAFVFILIVGLAGVTAGFGAGRVSAAIYFIFSGTALLFARSDFRMLRQGGVTGTKRIVRHLWRMCLALFIATFSFYPGQAKVFPKELRDTNLLIIPHVLLIGAMIYWMVRMRTRKRAATAIPAPRAADLLQSASPSPAIHFQLSSDPAPRQPAAAR
jgi:uncharacterized membrane protein